MRKVGLYERHGVREYWILDPEKRSVVIRVLGGAGRYEKPILPDLREVVRVRGVPGLEIDLAACFAALEEPEG